MKKSTVIIIFLIVILVIGVSIFLYIKKVKTQKTLDEQAYLAAIKAGVGKQGEDIDTILLNTKPDPKYTLSDADNTTLLAAKGGWTSAFIDSPTNLNKVLSGKTKAQLKALSTQFENKNGQKLDDFVRSIYSGITGFDQDEYNGILDIFTSAK